MKGMMKKNLLTLTATASAVLIALTGCAINSSPEPTTETSASFDTELSNQSLNNLDTLASRAVPILDNYDFRENLKTFLHSGKFQQEHEERLKELSSLVSHDEVWEAEKEKLLTMIDEGKVPVSKDYAGLYLDAVIVNSVFQPENLNDLDTVPKYSFDISSLNKADENGELSWSKLGGLSITNTNGMIYSVITPYEMQYFSKDGAFLSARNMTQQLENPVSEAEAKEALQGINEQIATWLSSTGLPLDESTNIENLAPEILSVISIPAVLTSSDTTSTEITGNTKDYKVSIVDGGKEYTISSNGETTIPEITQNQATLDLAPTDLKIGWDAYKAKNKLLPHNNSKETVNSIVASLNDENTDESIVWGVEEVDGYFYVVYIKDGEKNIFP